jgi:UDP-2,3-diacylglucosamine pyrophosphatase LpxH
MQGTQTLSNLYEASKEERASCSTQKQHYRCAFISDVHIGTKDCKAAQLNDFLKHYKFDKIYLVGDIFDGWRMRSGVHWEKSFNRVISRILKLSKKGVEIHYITGNHDEFLRKYANNRFENIKLLNRCDHLTADQRKLLVIHGDQFEGVTRCNKLLKMLGDHGYELLMKLNRGYNYLRQKSGYGYWSFSGFLKDHIKRAQKYIRDYEEAVAHGCKRQGYDGVICGHIHQAALKKIDGIDYYNTGDWVESCTAIIEDFDGSMHLMSWLDDPAQHEMQRLRRKKLRKKRRDNKAFAARLGKTKTA